MWYAIERFWTHMLASGGLIMIYLLAISFLGRRKGWEWLLSPKVLLTCACVANLLTGLLFEAWDYPSDGPYKTVSDVASWIAGSALTPWGFYRIHKLLSTPTTV